MCQARRHGARNLTTMSVRTQNCARCLHVLSDTWTLPKLTVPVCVVGLYDRRAAPAVWKG